MSMAYGTGLWQDSAARIGEPIDMRQHTFLLGNRFSLGSH